MRVQSLIVLAVILGAAAIAPRISGDNSPDFSQMATRSVSADGSAGAAGGPVLAGTATYYADAYHGQPMANGRPFDMHDPAVAASNDWPLGTRLIVRRAAGSPWENTLTAEERARYYAHEIAVTIQDRGAFTHALDLSLGAFRLLGRPDEGVIRVEIIPAESQ